MTTVMVKYADELAEMQDGNETNPSKKNKLYHCTAGMKRPRLCLSFQCSMSESSGEGERKKRD